MAENRQIRSRCEEILNGLDIPQPFDLDEFCTRLERQRRRALKLIQIDAAPGAPCGMWVSARTTDYIFHVGGRSPRHRQQIIFHELGHLILGHQGGPWEETVIGRLLPDLDPRLIENMLSRVAYTTTQELEAETFADLMSVSLKKPFIPSPGPDLAPDEAEVVTRIERALSGTQVAIPRVQTDEDPLNQGDA